MYSTATSLFGSNSTTRALYGCPTPPTRTLGSSMPATTWALVITCCGAYTKPLPSRPWVPEAPSILTVLSLAALVAAAVTLSPVGLATSAVDSFSNGLKTCGKPASVSAEVARENQFGVVSGMESWTAPRRAESRMAVVTSGDEEAPSTLAAPQATMSTATELAAAPPTPSATLSGPWSSSRRSLSASRPASSCPTAAGTSTVSTAVTVAAVLPGATRSIIHGSTHTPTIAPPTNPASETQPATRPRR